MASLLDQIGNFVGRTVGGGAAATSGDIGSLVTQIVGSADTVAADIDALISQALRSGAATPPPAPATSPYGAVYAFGDSLTDAGNDSILTHGAVPPSPPYSDGRFSNGPVWVQDFAQGLGLAAVQPSLAGGTDFAYGGAQTGTTPSHTAGPTDLPAQLAQFQTEEPHPAANALYAVWIGTNDVLAGASGDALATVDAAVGNEMRFLDGLVADGARNLLVLNVPDLGTTPLGAAQGTAQAAALTADSGYYDALLAANLQTFAMANPQVHVTTVDTFALLDRVEADPTAYGFSVTATPLVTSGLRAASGSPVSAAAGREAAGYLFFDTIHPTAQGQALIATRAAQALGVA